MAERWENTPRATSGLPDITACKWFYTQAALFSKAITLTVCSFGTDIRHRPLSRLHSGSNNIVEKIPTASYPVQALSEALTAYITTYFCVCSDRARLVHPWPLRTSHLDTASFHYLRNGPDFFDVFLHLIFCCTKFHHTRSQLSLAWLIISPAPLSSAPQP